jgi:hypothetical protein
MKSPFVEEVFEWILRSYQGVVGWPFTNDPSKSVLKPGITFGNWIFFLVAMGFVVGAIIFFQTIKFIRKHGIVN